MNVFSKIGSFVNRHRKKFITGGIIISGTILLAKYGQYKLKEWQENQAKEFLDRTRKQHHFENTERTCNQTILKLLPSLEEHLTLAINTEEIIAELRNSPENKLELWNKLKLMVFTRASCVIYATVLLVIMLRVQLNILGGHIFKKTADIETEIQEKYLLLSNNLLEVGIKNIAKVIEEKFVDIVGPMELKRNLSLKNLEDIFWAVQSTVATSDSNPLENISRHFISELPIQKSLYSEMVLDTIDLLDSDEVKSIAVHCINRGFALLSDQLADFYVPAAKIQEIPINSRETNFISPLNIDIPIAKLIPIVNGLCTGKFPNSLLQQLICNEKIKVLGANIYESFSYV